MKGLLKSLVPFSLLTQATQFLVHKSRSCNEDITPLPKELVTNLKKNRFFSGIRVQKMGVFSIGIIIRTPLFPPDSPARPKLPPDGAQMPSSPKLAADVPKKGQPMEESVPIAAPSADSKLLIQVQRFLTNQRNGLFPGQELEAAWKVFYDLYLHKIRKYAFTCGVAKEDIADCVQEVWTELLVRLPSFRLDPTRGKFDTWLFHIVRGKTVDLCRSHKRRFLQENSDTLQTVIDYHPNPARTLEQEEIFTLAWHQLRKSLSECNLQVLQLRLVEQRPVAEVAEKLGLSHEQVWYRYRRARRELEEIGSALARNQRAPPLQDDLAHEKTKKDQKFAPGKAASSVSRIVRPSSFACQGGNCVDYVFQRLELGRRELNPEWKVEWNCDALPRPVLYIRKLAIVAYAEMCGSGDFISTHWPRIVNAALVAGVAAGIATIIATPTAALPIFQTEFHKQLQGKGGSALDQEIQVALSAKQEANGPWCVCKD